MSCHARAPARQKPCFPRTAACPRSQPTPRGWPALVSKNERSTVASTPASSGLGSSPNHCHKTTTLTCSISYSSRGREPQHTAHVRPRTEPGTSHTCATAPGQRHLLAGPHSREHHMWRVQSCCPGQLGPRFLTSRSHSCLNRDQAGFVDRFGFLLRSRMRPSTPFAPAPRAAAPQVHPPPRPSLRQQPTCMPTATATQLPQVNLLAAPPYRARRTRRLSAGLQATRRVRKVGRGT
jgi:hypothetical protein